MTFADWFMIAVGAMGVAFFAYGVCRAWRERGVSLFSRPRVWHRAAPAAWNPRKKR